jgi:hypothetical protein
LVEKLLVWVAVISLCKIFFTSSAFDAPIYAKTGHSRPLVAALYWLLYYNIDQNFECMAHTRLSVKVLYFNWPWVN